MALPQFTVYVYLIEVRYTTASVCVCERQAHTCHIKHRTCTKVSRGNGTVAENASGVVCTRSQALRRTTRSQALRRTTTVTTQQLARWHTHTRARTLAQQGGLYARPKFIHWQGRRGLYATGKGFW